MCSSDTLEQWIAHYEEVHEQMNKIGRDMQDNQDMCPDVKKALMTEHKQVHDVMMNFLRLLKQARKFPQPRLGRLMAMIQFANNVLGGKNNEEDPPQDLHEMFRPGNPLMN